MPYLVSLTRNWEPFFFSSCTHTCTHAVAQYAADQTAIRFLKMIDSLSLRPMPTTVVSMLLTWNLKAILLITHSNESANRSSETRRNRQ